MIVRQTLTSLFLGLMVMLISSCGASKLRYIRDISDKDIDTTVLFTPSEDYKIQPGDILYIRLLTGNEEVDQMFNLMGSSGNSMSAGMSYYTGYVVNDSGNIKLPLLREIYVQGQNVRNIEKNIEETSKNYLKDAMAIVKLSGFKFTVLGEVRNPGNKELTTVRINIFEAIASAGEISYYGKRDEVLILRRENNVLRQTRVDLTSPSIVNSPYYYIHPNDILYIQPMAIAAFKVRVGDFLTILGAITSVATAAFLVANLK